jgi:AcrR family transcriptional regulator
VLTKSGVLEAALSVVDVEGLEALTMRRLGEELGADPMSVYRYVDGKDALLDALSEALWAQVSPPSGRDDWAEDLRSFARSIRDVFHQHPTAASLMIRRFLTRAALEVSHGYLEVLRRAGFGSSRAAEVIRSIVSFSIGYGLQEVDLGTPSTGRGSPVGAREFLVSLGQALPADSPAHLIETAIALCADCDPDACFEFGLELIVQGVRKIGPGPGGRPRRAEPGNNDPSTGSLRRRDVRGLDPSPRKHDRR